MKGLDVVIVCMKPSVCVALIALLPLQIFADNLLSEDYQAGIREATERYRGDCTENPEIVISAEYYMPWAMPSEFQHVAAPLSSHPFTLPGTFTPDSIDPTSVRWQRATP